MKTPYVEIYNREGERVETMLDGCARYVAATELDMLERGYTIKINGRKLCKKELKENGSTKIHINMR